MRSQSESEVLLVTDVPNLPSPIIMWASRTYGPDKVRGSTALTVLTDILQTGGKLDFENSSVSAVISLAETPGFHNWAWLLEVARVLKTGGDFRIQEPLVSRKPTDEELTRLASTPAQDKVNLERSLLLAGFVNVEMEEIVDGVGLSNEYKFITPTHILSIHGPLLKSFAMKANKPIWDSGSTFAIKKKIIHGHQGPKLAQHYTYESEIDRHTEAMAQTDEKCYRDANVSAKIIHDQNHRYLDPYQKAYDQQTEAMVQTESNINSKDMLTGSDTPLYIRAPSPGQFHQTEESFQPKLSKPTFKLDLSRVCAGQDNFELVDDPEAFTDEDNNSSVLHHEPSTCRSLKRPCTYCLGGPCNLEVRKEEIDYFSPWQSEKASPWIAKFPCKLCKVLIIKFSHWCWFEGKHTYRELKVLTTLFMRKLQQLIIHLTPYCRSFIASSSSWPIIGLFVSNPRCKNVQVDKAIQACFQSTKRPSCLCSHKLVDTMCIF